MVSSATHLVYAYRFTSTGDGVVENFHSDHDHGVGLQLLRAMRNRPITDTIFVATRDCGPTFRHIGNKRFENVISTCLASLEA